MLTVACLRAAATDEALAFDVQAVKTFGLNMVRLHQKVNPQRWYWYADTLGVVVLQVSLGNWLGAEGVLSQLQFSSSRAFHTP